MQIKINELTLAKVLEQSQFTKEKCKDTSTLEETAQKLMKILYQTFITDSSNSAIVLTRFFKSCSYCDLPDDIQGYIKQKEARTIIPPQDKYLTLLGTWGDLEEWRHREKSENYKAFSLNDSDVLYKFPMLSAVFSQIGYKIPTAIEPDKSIIVDKQDIDYGLFYVEDAKGSKYIPKQAEFVVPFGVKSAFGIGGHYVGTDIYAIIIFLRENISLRTAKLFLSLNPAIKFLTLRCDFTKNIFLTDRSKSKPSDALAEIQNMPDSQKAEYIVRNEESRVIADELKRANEALLEMTETLNEKNVELMNEITERKQADEELYNSEKKYRELTERMGELVYIADPTTFVATYINNAVEEVYGYTQKEWLSDNALWEKTIHSDDYEGVMSKLEEAQKNGKDIILEYRIVTRNGKIKWVEDRAFWKKNEKGNIIEFSGILIDITERKKAEKILQEQKKILEQKNIALNEILGQIEIEKKQIKDNVMANAENLLLPIIQKLRLKGESRKYVKLLRTNVQELTSSFGTKLTEKEAKLTSREIEICNMIKNGLTNKEIANLLNITLGTIERHRANIRSKLGVVNKNINLSSFLRTL
ncbi:MAG: PAS domain-containing protein [Candidatus Brocadiales bacterium]|nr:PAS domain-containing protein [Candidatus Brocadiales bacterium]